MPWDGTLTPLVDGQEITGEILDDYFGVLAAVSGQWTDYTPVWTAAVTNPVIVNGTPSGRYLQVGKFIVYTGSIVMGSGTTFGSSTWFVSMPVTPSAAAIGNTTCPGTALFYDASTVGNRQSGTVSIFSTTQVDFYIAGGGQVTSAAPFTWTQNDILGWTLMYEAA